MFIYRWTGNRSSRDDKKHDMVVNEMKYPFIQKKGRTWKGSPIPPTKSISVNGYYDADVSEIVRRQNM